MCGAGALDDRSEFVEELPMQISIKKMESDKEIKGKAFVHFKSWQEAYSGIVQQAYLDERTIDKCEERP